MWLELLVSDFRSLAQNGLVVVLALSAFFWGGAPERAVAATWLIIFEIGGQIRKVYFGDTVQLMEIDVYLALSDLLAAGCFIAIALHANRNYTLVIAAMQILAITAHMARGLGDTISPIGYAIMFIAPGWIQLTCLAIGLWRHIARKRIFGAYRDWRISSASAAFNSGNAPAALYSGRAGEFPVTWRDNLK